jgi:hypothetical protein
VSNTLFRLADQNVTADVWSTDLFGSNRENLQRMMGILLNVPEIRENLKEATGGPQPDGNKLARMISDWVTGRPLPELARDYFQRGDDAVEAMTRCCRSVFGKLTQTASWGLAALQSLTLAGQFDNLSPSEQRRLRNLPARVYYGVNSDEAIALRLLGVPRMAAPPLAERLNVRLDEPLSELRARLRNADVAVWAAAMGGNGESYRRVWAIIEGDA